MAYTHTVQYYETDKMNVTHHSNYIRWMEEARVAFLSEIGWDFPKLEEMGIVSPVLNVTCDYRKSTTFSDKVTIHVSVERFMGVKLQLAYVMENETGEVVCRATSVHAFLDAKGRPVRMKQEYPGLYQAFTELAAKSAGNQ